MEAGKLPELVVCAIESACASGRKLSWKIQESDRGMLVQLVWKPASVSRCVSDKTVSNWSTQKRKTPSRLRRDARRLKKFQAESSKPSQLDVSDTEHSMYAEKQPAFVPETAEKQSSAVTDSGTEHATEKQPAVDNIAVPVVPSDTGQLPAAGAHKPEVGEILKLDSPHFVHYVRSNGEIRDWDAETSRLPLVPLLHHGAVASGMKKSRFCFNHLKERCRRASSECPFAHTWDERLEYVCPACTEDGLIECERKRQHMSSYRLWGVYVVQDGRTVSEYLNSL